MTPSQPNDQHGSSQDWLVLVPTRFELELIQQKMPPGFPVVLEVCGFGPVVPAARTIQLIQMHQPENILLLGIAGSYSEHLPVGQAYAFQEVACYGVGVGQGRSFQTAQTMGWHHWLDDRVSMSIGDKIELSRPIIFQTDSALGELEGGKEATLLVTATSAAEDPDDVEMRLMTFPDAVAEDMEGFAVAAACRLSEIPLSIVRGISNRAGQRDKSQWRIVESLSAAVELSQKIIKGHS